MPMKPLEYKTRISESGTGATVECRLKVLTSQLEDMLFRIKFTLLDADNNELSPLLVARSEPIKVISKPEQPRKQKTRTKKRTLNDMLLDTLSRIEKMQQIQQERLQQITQTVSDVGGITATTRLTSVLHHHAPPLLPATAGGGGASSSSSSSSSSLSSLVALGGNVGFSSMATTPSATTTSSSYNDGHRNKKQKLLDGTYHHRPTHSPSHTHSLTPTHTDDRPLDFELAFRDLLDSFEALPPEQRFEQLRRFLENSGTSLDSLSELHDLFSSEGLERPIGSQVPRVGPADEEAGTTFSADGELTCECQDCPHKLELERIEEFYKEVFSLG